jgi:hypothetical protein
MDQPGRLTAMNKDKTGSESQCQLPSIIQQLPSSAACNKGLSGAYLGCPPAWEASESWEVAATVLCSLGPSPAVQRVGSGTGEVKGPSVALHGAESSHCVLLMGKGKIKGQGTIKKCLVWRPQCGAAVSASSGTPEEGWNNTPAPIGTPKMSHSGHSQC